jgi:hypothetical protein
VQRSSHDAGSFVNRQRISPLASKNFQFCAAFTPVLALYAASQSSYPLMVTMPSSQSPNCPAQPRYRTARRFYGICCALHSIANNSRRDSLRGAKSPKSPETRPTLSEGCSFLPSFCLSLDKLTKPGRTLRDAGGFFRAGFDDRHSITAFILTGTASSRSRRAICYGRRSFAAFPHATCPH